MTMTRTYYATLELDPRSKQWMADIEGLPVHTWGRSLGKVKQFAHAALATHLDVPLADLDGRIVFRRPQLPDLVLHAIEEAETARAEADGATARAAEAKAAAARALVDDAHLSCATLRKCWASRTSASSSSWLAETPLCPADNDSCTTVVCSAGKVTVPTQAK